MILLLSPSKTQDFSESQLAYKTTIPTFAPEVHILVQNLQQYSVPELMKLMKISSNLAELNVTRYQAFAPKFDLKTAKPALWAFKGDVYTDIQVDSYTGEQVAFANGCIRILSGLYGVLKPLDLIQPYRLEMKTKLKVDEKADLYKFWGDKVTESLNNENPDFILNLASEEYFKVINPKLLKADLINVDFKEKRGDDYKIIAIYAKKARGTMANFIVRNGVTELSEVKKFNLDGYSLNPDLSVKNKLVFTR